MSKKVSIVVISIIIVISLLISIYIPNKDKIQENEDISVNYSIIEKNGKVGIIENENIIIDPQYEKIIILNPHRAVFVCKNGADQKIVNAENKEIFKDYNNVQPIEIDNMQYEKNILTYEKDGKYGILGITGKTLTEAKYEEITSLGFKEGEVLVKENGKYGILQENGNVKIKSEYDLISGDEYYTEESEYKESGYIVRKTTDEGYRYGYYDCDGIQVLDEEYNQINRLTQIQSDDIYLIAAKNGQYGVFVNNSKIINTQYQTIEYNSDLQIFVLERTGKFGAANSKGAIILETNYNELQINGIYLYTIKDEEKKVWDTSGKEVDINFDTIIQKTNSEYFVKNDAGNYSILNSNFEVISKQTYKYLEFIYDNYFIATNEQDKSGIIDIEENIIIDFKYDVIQLIKDKFIVQAIDFSTNITDFYNKDFSLSAELDDANIEYLDNGFKVYNDEQEILLDDNGKIIAE